MAKKTKTLTAEDRLRALYDLQLIDSRIDRIRVIRGELPMEVEDLKNEIDGLHSRLSKMEEENDSVNHRIVAYTNQIEEAKSLIFFEFNCFVQFFFKKVFKMVHLASMHKLFNNSLLMPFASLHDRYASLPRSFCSLLKLFIFSAKLFILLE